MFARRTLLLGAAALILPRLADAQSVGGGSGVSNSSASAAWNPSRLAGIVSAWSANTAVSSGGLVSSMPAYGNFPIFQYKSGTQPALTSGRVVFNGAASTYLSANNLANASATTLPDGAGGSQAGKGFTCTGLVKDTTDGTWWMGNYGIATPAQVGTATFAASIVHLSADFSTIIANYTLASMGITQNTTLTGPQGVTIDTSTNTIFFACPEINNVYQISKTGTLLNTLTAPIAPVGGFGVNGITYDPTADQLAVCIGTGNNGGGNLNSVVWINKSTGATIRTLSLLVGISHSDHLFIDPNDAGNIYISGDGSGTTPSNIWKYNKTTGVLTAPYSATTILTIEGIYLDGTTWYVSSDAFFHLGTLNQVLTASVSLPSTAYPAVGTRYQIFGTGVIPSAGGSAQTLVCIGSPVDGVGSGLFFPASSTSSFRFFQNGSNFDYSGVTTTTEFFYFIDVDLVAKSANLYVNGLFVASKDTSAASQTAPGQTNIDVGALFFGGALSNFSSGKIANLGITNGEQANQQIIEGWVAWDAGLQALLPVSSPYKTKRP